MTEAAVFWYPAIMKTITITELIKRLSTINRPQPVAFTALVPVEAKAAARTELPGRLMKLSRYRAWIGDYGRMVTAQIHREGMPEQVVFQPKPRKWGQHVSMALVSHTPKGTALQKHYLSVQVKGATSPLYLVEQPLQHSRAKRRRLLATTKEAVAHLLPPKRPEGTNQGTETPIIHRDVDLSHVTCVSIGGEVLKVVSA